MSRALVAVLILLSGSALATTLRPLSLAELAAGADTVVRGRVGEAEVTRSERSGRILTRTRVEVLETLKGRADATLTVEQLGGRLEGQTLRVPGDAQLERSEEVVLFLRCAGKPRCHLYGLGLGKYTVRRSGEQVEAVRDATGFTFAPGGPAAPASMPLETLLAAVRGAGR